MFLQHALFCHVRQRSLLFIPIEVEMAEVAFKTCACLAARYITLSALFLH